jgi:filamentous hemagglutinin
VPAAQAQTLPSSIGSATTVSIPDGQVWTASGSIANQGTVAVGGTAHPTLLELTSGATLSGGGTVSLASASLSDIANGNTVVSYTLTNQDNTITGSGQVGAAYPAYLSGGAANPGLTLVNAAAGRLDAEAGGNLAFYLAGASNSGLAEANNGGTLTLGGPGNFNNTGGTVAASQGGIVNLGAGNAGSNTGTIQATAGGTLNLDLTLTNTGGTVQAQGAGSQVTLNNGMVVNGAVQANNGGTVALNAGTIQGATLSGNGSFVASGGTLNAVTLAAGTSFGVQDGASVGLSGTLTNQGSLAIGGATAATILNITVPTTLTGGGTITLGSGSFSDIANSGSVVSNTLTNQNNTIIGSGQIGASYAVYRSGASSGAGLLLVNQSAGRIEASGSPGLNVAATSVTNNGTFQADSGSKLLVTGQVTNVSGSTLNGGTYAALNGTIALAGADVVNNAATIVLSGAGSRLTDTAGNDALRSLAANLAGGSLTVSGGRTVTTPDGFSNAGVLGFGPGGVVDVTGGFTQATSGTLDFVLGGTTPSLASTLDVGGSVTLGGALTVSLATGFSLAAGDTFPLIDFTPGSLGPSRFATTTLPAAPPGMTLEELFLPDSLELLVAGVPEPSSLALLAFGLLAALRCRGHRRAG